MISRLAFIAVLIGTLPAPSARADESVPQMLGEVRNSFRLGGRPIPPEIFRDMGAGDLADSRPIRVAIDVKAAVGSNLYGGDIKSESHGWVAQRTDDKTSVNGTDEYAYRYIGPTANGLLVIIARANTGGTGTFTTLHILDVTAVKAFNADGQIYERINVTTLRDIALGDRWDGTAKIDGNRTVVTTTRAGPTDESGTARVIAIEARRP